VLALAAVTATESDFSIDLSDRELTAGTHTSTITITITNAPSPTPAGPPTCWRSRARG
jgi:hypothetical protein